MHKPVVIVGLGEMAGVFARGFLRSGYPVYPVTRNMDITAAADAIPEPEFVLIAVAEADIQTVLSQVPAAWRDKLVLLQNELLPHDWQAHGLDQTTVISVWFEKKKGQDSKVLVASPVYGPHATSIQTALQTLDIACCTLDNADQLQFELVRKNVYILTTNIAGLAVGGNVAQLWQKHETLARAVANDVMDIQQHLVGQELPREPLIQAMLVAFDGDPEHKCMGRSAQARLQRALQIADKAGLAVAQLKAIAAQHL